MNPIGTLVVEIIFHVQDFFWYSYCSCVSFKMRGKKRSIDSKSEQKRGATDTQTLPQTQVQTHTRAHKHALAHACTQTGAHTRTETLARTNTRTKHTRMHI